LGFEPTHSPERAAEKAQRERDREVDQLIDRIFAEWRGGAYGNAWRTIEAHLKTSPRPSEDLRELFVRAEQWPDGRLAYRLAQELLPQLLTARRTGDALSIVRSQLRADAHFKPIASADTIKLIELARDAGDRRTARMLLEGFDDKYDDQVARRIAAQLAQQLER
jgi:succinate dehydrogenase/fumarate reductase flavoprotein subunit